MKKNGRRWLALILAVALVSSNALYQLGTQMSASESENSQQTASVEEETQTQEATVDTADQQDQSQGDQAVQVQEVPSTDAGETADAQQKVTADNTQQAADQTGAVEEKPEATQEKTVDVKIQKPEADGGQITAWGTDGNKSEVTYDGNNQYVKTVKEGETFNFEITVKDSYKVAKVADQNGTEIQPKAVNGSVYTYEVTNITSERVFNITYNKEETSTSSKKDQKKSDDKKSDDADDEGDSAKVKARAKNSTMAVAQSTDEIKNVEIGKTITLAGTESKYPISWTSSDSNVATVTGSKNQGTVKGVASGVATITYKYWAWNSELRNWVEKTETWTVYVGTLKRLTKVKISGDSTVKAFEDLQLSASVEPTNAVATYTWESSDTSVLSVDANGKVTTYKPGKAMVTVRATGYDESQTTVSATKEITVESATKSTDDALFYYLISPTSDPDSNASSAWGTSMGTGTITTTNTTWVNNKNSFDNVDSRVISWPSGNGTAVAGGFELSRESSHWDTIFNNYQSEIANKYPGQTITKDDVEAIIIHPYKISKNNSSNPDKHVDCTVEIKVKNFYTATYKVQDANTVGYVWKEGDTYREGEETSPQGTYPTEKTVNGVRYTFSGWYDNESLSGSPITFPYTMRENVTFYAKYVAGYNVTYELDGGTWDKAQNTEYYQVGNTVYVTNSVPEKPGYTFEGWTYSEDDSKTYQANAHFEMPEKNVTLTAKWKEKPGKVGYNLVLKGAQWNADVSSYLESNGLSQGGAQKYVEKVKYAKGDKFTVTSDEPVADGYAFVGWFDKDRSNSGGGGATVRSAGEKVTYVYKDDTYTLDALWVGINANGENVTYDGRPHTITNETGFTKGTLDDKYVQDATSNVKYGTVYYSKDSGKTWTAEKPSFVNAGEYTVLVKQEVTVGGKKTELKASAVVTINKRTVTLTSADDKKPYDGTALTNSKVTVGGDGFAEDEGATYDVTGSQTDVGTSKNTFSYTLKKGVNPDNYTITKKEGTLKVTPVTKEVVVTITGHTGGEKYNGSEQTVSGYDVSINNTLYKNTDFAFSGTAEVKGTNAGNYPMGLKASDFANANTNFTNVKFVVTDGQLDIAKREVTLTSASDEKVYDGNALTNENVTVSGDEFAKGEGATYHVTGSQTDEGTSDNTFTYELNEGTNKDNYNITQVPGKLTVKADESEVVVTITGNKKSEKYSGEEQTVTDYTVSIGSETYSEKDFSFKGTAKAKGTDVGTYPMGLKASDFVNNNKNFKKVTFVVTDGTLEITKRDVTLTSGSSSRQYTGSALTNENVTVSGDEFAKGEGATYDVTGTITNVGKVNNEFTYKLKDGTNKKNYNITTVPGELEVTPVTSEVVVKITGNHTEDKYDGTEKKASGYVVTNISNTLYKNSDFTFSGTAVVTRTNAGETEMGLDAKNFQNENANFKNVKFEVTDGYVKVEKRTVIMTSATDSRAYNGKALTNKKVTESGDGFAKGEGATYDVTGSQKVVGSSDNTFTYELNSNTKVDNYDITKNVGTLTITNREAKYEITVEANSDKVPYDGKDHSAAGLKTTTFTVDGETYTVEGLTTEDPTKKDAGTYTNNITGKAIVKDAAGNDVSSEFTVNTENGKLVIEKAKVTLKSADLDRVYNGTALVNGSTPLATESGFAAGESTGYTFNGSQTEVGESKNAFTVNWDENAKESNYDVTIEFGTLKVTKQSIVPGPDPSYKGIKINDPSDVPYNGQEQKWAPTVTDASGKVLTKGTDYTVSYDKDDFTNVTGVIKVTIKGTGNYKGSVTKNYQILPREYTVTTDGDSKTYDGEPLTVAGYRVENVLEKDGYSFRTTGSQTEVGESDNTYTLTWNDEVSKNNYKLASETLGKLVVTETTDSIVAVVTGGTHTYDGNPHGATVTVTGLPKGYSVKTAKSNTSLTDVSKATAKVDELVIVNANGEDVTAKLNIDKSSTAEVEVTPATLTITTPDASRVYDGNALTKAGTISGFVNEETATFVTTGSQTEVGDSENTYTLTWDGTAKESNYTISKSVGTLKVTAQSIVPGPDPENPDKPDPSYKGITINDPSDVPYDSKEHKWTPVVKDKDGNELKEGTDYEVTYNKKDYTNVTGAIEVTITGKGNYTGSVTKSYQITPASVSIKTNGAERVYNGKPLTADGEIKGLVNNETVDFKVTGSQTEVGDSKNTYTLNWTGTAKESNYQIVSKEIGTLVVTENAKEIVVTTTGGTFTYTGLAHGATVTVSELPEGYTLDTAESTATATDVTDKKGVAATADKLVIRNAQGKDVTDKLKITKIDGTIKVTPAALTITTPKANKVYDGNALTAAGTISGFVNNETATFETTGSQTEVGDSENTYTLTWDGTAKETNYTVSESIGTLKVTEQSIVPKPDPENPDKPDPNYKGITINDPSDVPYDGKEHKWTPVVKDKDGNKLEEGKDYEVSYNDKDDFTNVTGEITVTITGKGNYSGTVDKVYKITPREVTITTDSATRVFNNEALTAPGRVVGIVEGETYGFEVTGSQTYVGKSVNSYEMTWAAEGKNEYTAKKSNYNVTVNTGLLTVTDGTPEKPVEPSLVVNKTHNTDKTYKVGDVITFTITVKNIYDEAKTITLKEQEGVTLDKTTFADVKPGEVITAKATYTVTEADIVNGTFTNNVKATFSGADKEYKGTDTVDKFEKSNPHMTITKTTKGVNENHTYKLGDTIKYEITVENDGNLTLTNVKIEDALTGNAGDNAWTIDTLKPGDTKKFEASYTVTEADVLAEKVVNNVTGKAENPDPKKPETPVTPGEKKDPVETPNPSLTVIKTADKTGEVKLGEEIKYTITVTNNGNVTISGVKLNDSLTGDEWTLGDIKPGKTVTKETTYTVTEKDIIAGEIRNLATAEGKDPTGKDVKGEGEKTVTTDESNPQITVTKKTTSKPANGETYALGEKITYEITAKNTGNLTLTDVTVSDELTGNTGNKAFKIEGKFKPNDEVTFKTSYTVKESDLGKKVVNVATATGKTPDQDKPTPEVIPGKTEDSTDQKNPKLSITKKVIDKKDEYQIGDTVEYEITVENTGNTTQNNVLVEDQMKAAGAATITKVEGAKGTINGANVTLDTLAPGKTATITAEYTVVKEDRGNTITNAAVAKGEGEIPETPEVPVDVEEVYDIHVEHVFADGEEGDVALPEDYDIENLKPGTSKILEAEAVEGYVAYPSTKTVTIENEDVTVTFIYYKDTIGTDPTNPDQPDNIPDRYQVVVRFEAVNGTVTHDHAVVTLFDENNEPAVNGIGHLSFFQIAGARANAGYDQSSLNWSPQRPTTGYDITGEMTFTARFTAIPVIPQNNPQTPSNPGVINRVVDTVTNVPQAAANAVRNFAADVQEVFDSDDGDVPLENQKLDDHDCCILHFLIMLITAILYGFFTHNMKKRQKKNFELREELDTELAKRGLPTSREQEAN